MFDFVELFQGESGSIDSLWVFQEKDRTFPEVAVASKNHRYPTTPPISLKLSRYSSCGPVWFNCRFHGYAKHLGSANLSLKVTWLSRISYEDSVI
jgi:hypothetical protein